MSSHKGILKFKWKYVINITWKNILWIELGQNLHEAILICRLPFCRWFTLKNSFPYTPISLAFILFHFLRFAYLNPGILPTEAPWFTFSHKVQCLLHLTKSLSLPLQELSFLGWLPGPLSRTPLLIRKKNLFKCPYCLITRHWFKDNSRHTYLLGCIHLRCILRKFYRKMRASCFSICPQMTLSLIMHLCQVSHWQNRKPSEPKGSILACLCSWI